MVRAHVHVIAYVCVWNFGTKFFEGGENVRPEKISIFLKKGKIVISVENPEFF